MFDGMPCVFTTYACFVVYVCPHMHSDRLRVKGLTDDDGGDLVSAGPVLVLDLTGEGGVDGVVHLPHCQLVALHHHRLGQRPRCPGWIREGKEGRKDGGKEQTRQ